MQNINPLTGKKNDFSILKGKKLGKRIHSKHQASKRGYKHVKKLSRGELNHQKFVMGKLD